MKKIIDGRKYDTEKSERICGFRYGFPEDLQYHSGNLYRTSWGEFFLYEIDGPESEFIECDDDGIERWRKDITPISDVAAMMVVEGHGSVDVYEKLFGVISDPAESHITLIISKATMDKLLEIKGDKTVEEAAEEVLEKALS